MEVYEKIALCGVSWAHQCTLSELNMTFIVKVKGISECSWVTF